MLVNLLVKTDVLQQDSPVLAALKTAFGIKELFVVKRKDNRVSLKSKATGMETIFGGF